MNKSKVIRFSIGDIQVSCSVSLNTENVEEV